MQKTTHYQLSQWDGTDRILRQDFNGDNARLDAALAALQGGVDGAKSAAASAVSQARTDLTAAINTAKSDLTSALNSAKSSLSSTISANKSHADSEIADIHAVMTQRVRILDTSFTGSGGDKALSVSGSTLGRCLFFILDITPASGAGGASCLSVDSAGTGKVWTGYSGNAVTGKGVGYVRDGVRNRFVGFPMGDGSSPVSLIGLGGNGEPQQGCAELTYSSLRNLYIKGSLYGTWKVKLVGVFCEG